MVRRRRQVRVLCALAVVAALVAAVPQTAGADLGEPELIDVEDVYPTSDFAEGRGLVARARQPISLPGFGTLGRAITLLERVDGDWQFRTPITVGGTTIGPEEITAVGTDGTRIVAAVPDFPAAVGNLFLYEETNGAFEEVAAVPAPGTGGLAGFGASVAVSGDWVAVGRPADGSGSVLLYKFEDGDLTFRQTLRPRPIGDPGDAFGASVAMAGSDLIVGVPSSDRTAANAGDGVIFGRTGDTWSQVRRFGPPAGFTQLGTAVDVSLGTFVASGLDHAVTLQRTQSGWIRRSLRSPLDQTLSPPLMRDVAIHVDRIAMAADNLNLGEPSMFTYERSGSNWTHTGSLVAPDGVWDQAQYTHVEAGPLGVIAVAESTDPAELQDTDVYFLPDGPQGGDADGDGIEDGLDGCPGTVLPGAVIPSGELGVGRWANLEADPDFDTPEPDGLPTFTMHDTAGCSVEQIVAAFGMTDPLVFETGAPTAVLSFWVAIVDYLRAAAGASLD